MAKKPSQETTGETAPENVIPLSEGAAPEESTAPTGPRYDWPIAEEKRPLFVVLNPSELEEQARKLAGTVREIGRLEGDAKASAAQWKSRIENEKSKQNHLSTIVAEGREERPVDCEWVYECCGLDSVSGERIHHPEKKALFRKDNGELIEVREITSEERQMSLLPEDEPAGE